MQQRATGRSPAPDLHSDDVGRLPGRDGLLCISQRYPPATTPTAVRAGKLVGELAARWDVTLLTEERPQRPPRGVSVTTVRSRRPMRLLGAMRRLRLNKLLELVIWPDDSIFWLAPAVLAGRRAIRERRPSAIVVFMMPYSAGLVGLVLARISGLPLILNLDDSPTCTDMHPDFPSRLHYHLARALEDLYARSADSIVYVSETNLELVRSRQAPALAEKFRLVRYGADQTAFHTYDPSGDRFEIVYVGAMSGWWSLIEQQTEPGRLKRMYLRWTRLGRHRRTELDTRTASPAVIGEALLRALDEHPDWRGRVSMSVYDNTYPRSVTERALAAAGIEEVVDVRDAVGHELVADILARADLLFLTLPRRVDGSRGGRISAKTYEYLMTDRPILAALPSGENWDYLSDKPGVWLAATDDAGALHDAIVELATAKLQGSPRTFAREQLHEQIAYSTRAREFEGAIRAAIAHKRLQAAAARGGPGSA